MKLAEKPRASYVLVPSAAAAAEDMMYSVAAAGLVAFVVNLLNQPLILGCRHRGSLTGLTGSLQYLEGAYESLQALCVSDYRELPLARVIARMKILDCGTLQHVSHACKLIDT